MARKWFFAATLLALLGAGAVAARQKYDPFKVPRDQVVASVKTIAIRSPAVPKDHSRPEAVRAEFDTLITAELRAGGFVVVPPSEYDSLFKQYSDSLGGLFNPQTGEQDSAKAHLVRARVLHELRDQHHADALLHPSFQLVKAPFDAGVARWDGATQSIRKKGFLGFMDASQTMGTVAAISLRVVIEDTDGKDLYADWGGLHVMSKFGKKSRFEEIPTDTWFSDAKRNSDAVRLALGALTRPEKK